jgi:hypothetical protein
MVGEGHAAVGAVLRASGKSQTSPSPHPKERHSRTADVLLNHAVGGDQACGEVRRSPRRNLPAKAMPPFNLPAKAMPPFRQYFARVRLKNWP